MIGSPGLAVKDYMTDNMLCLVVVYQVIDCGAVLQSIHVLVSRFDLMLSFHRKNGQ